MELQKQHYEAICPAQAKNEKYFSLIGINFVNEKTKRNKWVNINSSTPFQDPGAPRRTGDGRASLRGWPEQQVLASAREEAGKNKNNKNKNISQIF